MSDRTKGSYNRRRLIAGGLLMSAPPVFLIAASLFAAPRANQVPPSLADLAATPFGQLSIAVFVFGALLTIRGFYAAIRKRLARAS